MKPLKFFFAIVAGIVGLAASAVTGELTDDAYVITVASGETETLPAEIGSAAKTSGKAIWKKGTGTLVVTNKALYGVTANIHVMEGIWKATGYYTCGQGSGYLSVSNNATLWLTGGDWSSSSTTASEEKTRCFHLAGTGANGIGALYNSASVRIQYLTLQDDALVTGAGMTLRQDGGPVALNGHTLTISLNNANCTFNFVCSTFQNDGDIVVEKGSLQFENTNYRTSVTAASTVTMKSGTRLHLRQKIKNTPMTLVMEDGASLMTSLSNPTTVGNGPTVWAGPVRIDGTVPFSSSTGDEYMGACFSGVVTGEGGFAVKDTLRLWLSNVTNAFKGGLALIGKSAAKRSSARILANGALPTDGGPVTLDNGALELLDSHESGAVVTVAEETPAIVCTSSGVVTQNVTSVGTKRRVRSLAKSGDGVLDLYGSLAVTGTTTLAGGTLRVCSRMPATELSGLKTWYRWVEPYSGKYYGNITTPSGTGTGNLEYIGISPDGPVMAYKAWSHVLCSVVYKGYLFVPGTENAIWNFALSNVRLARICIDGKTVLDQTDTYRNANKELYQMNHFQTSAPVTMTPGWHEFYLMLHNNYNSGSGPQGYEAKEIAQTETDGYAERYAGCFWKYNFAAAYNPNCDPTQNISSNSADYVAFTSDMLKPALDSTPAAMGYTADDFRLSFAGPLVCTPGTVLDLGDEAPYTPFAVPSLTGLTSITNGTLSVTNSNWYLRTADVLSDTPLTLADGSALTFPDGDVTISVTDLDAWTALRHNQSHVILRAEEGSSPPTNRFVLSSATAANFWCVHKTETELILERNCGLFIIVR